MWTQDEMVVYHCDLENFKFCSRMSQSTLFKRLLFLRLFSSPPLYLLPILFALWLGSLGVNFRRQNCCNAFVPRWGDERIERVFGSRVGIVGPHHGNFYEPIFSAELLGPAGPREVHGGAAYMVAEVMLILDGFGLQKIPPLFKKQGKQTCHLTSSWSRTTGRLLPYRPWWPS